MTFLKSDSSFFLQIFNLKYFLIFPEFRFFLIMNSRPFHNRIPYFFQKNITETHLKENCIFLAKIDFLTILRCMQNPMFAKLTNFRKSLNSWPFWILIPDFSSDFQFERFWIEFWILKKNRIFDFLVRMQSQLPTFPLL